MTILSVAVLLACLLAWRLLALRAAIRVTRAPMRLMDDAPAPTSHMVFSGPIEKNTHGFITTPLVQCQDKTCSCRTFAR